MRKILVIIAISAFLVTLPGVLPKCIYNRPEIYPMAYAAASVPLVFIPMPSAPGALVKENDKAEIDYSNTKDGYIMIRYLDKTDKAVRVIVKSPGGESYTYSLNSTGSYECFPLSEGNGSYQVGVYENIKDTKYSTLISAVLQVELTDEFAPFLRPNQYVNFSGSSETVKKAAEIVKDSSGIISEISSVYNYVSESITYDRELAKTVRSGYLPDVDTVLKKGKGICFDYAAVMTVMLRSRQIPTKLVIGYIGNAYHAWINIYSSETGWIDKAVYFDGVSWKLMDPTYMANKVTVNTSNTSYTAKLIY